jgi:hypothetical protein
VLSSQQHLQQHDGTQDAVSRQHQQQHTLLPPQWQPSKAVSCSPAADPAVQQHLKQEVLQQALQHWLRPVRGKALLVRVFAAAEAAWHTRARQEAAAGLGGGERQQWLIRQGTLAALLMACLQLAAATHATCDIGQSLAHCVGCVPGTKSCYAAAAVGCRCRAPCAGLQAHAARICSLGVPHN